MRRRRLRRLQQDSCFRGPPRRRHCHRREGDGGGGGGQAWHKDDYYYETPVRHKAAFRWIFALYYPTDTTLAMGPTAILPSRYMYSRISDIHADRTEETELRLVVPPGTVALIHFVSRSRWLSPFALW